MTFSKCKNKECGYPSLTATWCFDCQSDGRRIGEKKRYKGVFELARTDDITKYMYLGYLTSPKSIKGKLKINMNEDGIYLGHNLFITEKFGSDVFKE